MYLRPYLIAVPAHGLDNFLNPISVRFKPQGPSQVLQRDRHLVVPDCHQNIIPAQTLRRFHDTYDTKDQGRNGRRRQTVRERISERTRGDAQRVAFIGRMYTVTVYTT